MRARTHRYLLTLALLSTLFLNARSSFASDLVNAAGVAGGLVVHVGCTDGKLTANLRASDSYLVQGLDTDAGNVSVARAHIDSIGLTGKVTTDIFDGQRLPFIDNVVNLLVVSRQYNVSRDEMLRVLAPRGVALLARAANDRSGGGGQVIQVGGRNWRKIVKPQPATIDEWTHYLHGPDNNAVAHDQVVNAPRHMQWLAGPQWTRTHHQLNSISSVVTAQGRLFYILDDATAANVNVPSKWVIVARDAFSGVLLWKKPMASWASQRIRFRSGPPQVTRLLVASGNRVYAALGLNAPISVLNAATGKTLNTLEATTGAEEMVLTGSTLIVLKGSPVAEQAVGYAAFKGQFKLPNQKAIVAVNAQTGKASWEWSDPNGNPMPETLAADGKKVYVQIGEGVACLDLQSGSELWSYGQSGTETRRKRVTYGKYILVVSDDVVLCKLSDRLVALSAENGKKLWDCWAGKGFHSPLDLFVINGLVWQGSHVSDSVAPAAVQDFNEGRDLHTGEVKVTNSVAVDLQTSGHHHRCYREKATDRFILTSKRGIELIDVAGNQHSRNNWVRGTCQYGILPANGLIYSPPHSCGCYMESKLRGFWALAGEESRVDGRESRVQERLQRGPAYGNAPLHPSSFILHPSSDWPMYRCDALRSGVAKTIVPTELKQAWDIKIGGRLTQPVIADGKVVLAATDKNTVYAVDEKDGTLLWKYVASGPVDSPPAIHNGMVLFGSADGRVTCLRLSDGEFVWHFLAAPADVRTVARNRIESVWPVHGSVLVLDGIVFCSAGRSTWIDGGIELYGLDPATGKVLCKAHYESKHPEFRQGKEKDSPEYVTKISQNTTDYKTFLESDRSDAFSMAGGAVSDVLVSDGRNVFLHHVRFSRTLQKQDAMSRHLFSTSSLLDDTENHRSHWVLGTGDFSRIPVAYSWIVNRPGKRMPTIAVPTAVMMVYDEHGVWGVRRQGNSNGKYYLFQKQNKPFAEDERFLPDFRTIPASEVDRDVWKVDLPVRTTAMLKSGDRLCLGVAPIDIPENDPYAAYEGREGGAIWLCSDGDGSKIAEYKLSAPAVWDGMAAANEKLFVSTSDGFLHCLAAAP